MKLFPHYNRTMPVLIWNQKDKSVTASLCNAFAPRNNRAIQRDKHKMVKSIMVSRVKSAPECDLCDDGRIVEVFRSTSCLRECAELWGPAWNSDNKWRPSGVCVCVLVGKVCLWLMQLLPLDLILYCSICVCVCMRERKAVVKLN